jgi:exonuclease 1
MGITGLIPFCKEAISDISLFSLRNKNVTVAVDSYSWLHKGAYCCSDKLVKGVKTTAHIDYCMKFVNLLLQMNIRPIMVFDGK